MSRYKPARRLLINIKVLLTLQKLVRSGDDSDSDSDDEDSQIKRLQKSDKVSGKTFLQRISDLFKASPGHKGIEQNLNEQEKFYGISGTVAAHGLQSNPHFEEHIRTLQRYRGGPNIERTIYMERNSALSKKNLAVSVKRKKMIIT